VVTLAQARERRDEAKRLLAQGTGPSAQRKADKCAAAAQRTFGEVGDEWLATKREREDKSDSTLKRDRWLLRDLKAQLGSRPIAEIEPPELLAALRKVESQGHHETVARMRALASQVFRFGIASGYCARDAAVDLKGALTSRKSKPRPGLTDPVAVGQLCRDIDGYEGRESIVRLALAFLSITLVRPGEVTKAQWSEIDFDARKWTIAASKMKMRRDHEVPLSDQALKILETLRGINGKRRHVFSTYEDKPLSGNTFNNALRRMGYDTQNEHCAHGFRTTASTLLNSERDGHGKPVWHPDVIEVQLAHVDDDDVRAGAIANYTPNSYPLSKSSHRR
jgi:integrase